MKKTFLFALCAGLLACLSACTESHFLTNEAYRQRVESDFVQKQAALPQGDLFALTQNETLSVYEREALMFLYAYMPTADITDYSGEFHLMNVRAARRTIDEMPWGKEIPEELFRHFVLPVRINNEPLDSARTVFYEELKPRVENMQLSDAILEVNHWCHEKAIYTPSDSRTSSPLATVRTAYGRCGEESTFLVAALRSVGIPARQVYTPRWAHTDDNHAWVEAWADGRWHFLGACEPEPVLNLGWFNAPASRGMLMHTKVFGRYEGPEEVMSITPNFTEINVIDNYAPTALGKVKVTDAEGKPVAGAQVEYKIYNYAEFYTVARKTTDASGYSQLTAGKGDMLVWASHQGKFGFAKLSFGKQDEVNVQLTHQEGDIISEDIDMIPPAEGANLPAVTPEQREENSRRMALEDSIRHIYEATMLNEQEAMQWVENNYKGADLTAGQKDMLAGLLVKTRGNHATLTGFLKATHTANGALTEDDQRAWQLLQAISEKDLRDVRPEVLNDHWKHTLLPEKAEAYDTQILQRRLLNPRIANEELSTYKTFFQNAISAEEQANYRQEPQQLVEWCMKNITVNDSINSQRIPMTPAGVWKARVADRRSRDIFFVAVARSMGIPAWMDEVTGDVYYEALDKRAQAPRTLTFKVDLNGQQLEEIIPLRGEVRAAYKPTDAVDNPKYYTHFSISQFRNGSLRLMEYDESGVTWQSLLKNGNRMDTGYYALVSGMRLASGGVLAHINTFNVRNEEVTRTELVMREDNDEVQVIGNFNSEMTFTRLEAGKAGNKSSLLEACGRGYYVVAVLGVNQEPTNHALRDIAALKADLEKWGRRMVLLFPNETDAAKYKPESLPALPSTVIYGLDTEGIGAEMAKAMKLRHADQLPIFIIADTFNRVVFVSQGYTIGLGEQLMKTIKGL